MDKLKTLVDLLHDNKLNESNQLLEEIIKDKLADKLAEKKVEIASSMMFEGEIKVLNKKHKGQVTKRIGSNANREGMALSINKTTSGRLALKSFPKDVVNKLTKKTKLVPWYATEEVVDEQMNTSVQGIKKHIRIQHPHMARERNLKDRQKLENRLNSIARKRFK